MYHINIAIKCIGKGFTYFFFNADHEYLESVSNLKDGNPKDRCICPARTMYTCQDYWLSYEFNTEHLKD